MKVEKTAAQDFKLVKQELSADKENTSKPNEFCTN